MKLLHPICTDKANHENYARICLCMVTAKSDLLDPFCLENQEQCRLSSRKIVVKTLLKPVGMIR